MIDFNTVTKDELFAYTKEKFGVELDLTKHLAKLINEVKKLQVSKPHKDELLTAENPKATHILNRNTGYWFIYTQALADYLTNAVPCDKDGTPV